mmetsp:Transcript_23026/g.28229  ORF Transcript_23026/g.28229 Transcript_23026/m.28229 type:complete len:930 (+) Transcript_23026:82-2871(+)
MNKTSLEIGKDDGATSKESSNEHVSKSSPKKSISTAVERFISSSFYRLGTYVGTNPKKTILFSIILTMICAAGFARFETENRPEKLWVPQNTQAEKETGMYQEIFPRTARFNTLILSAKDGGNVLSKDNLVAAMEINDKIASTDSKKLEGETYNFEELCVKAGGSCANSYVDICQCLITSILGSWDYDLESLETDENLLETLNSNSKKNDFGALLGNAKYDGEDKVISAEAMTITYFTADRAVIENGNEFDAINEQWEGDVFLDVLQNYATNSNLINVEYLSARSFSDEFGGAITGDLALVQGSYVVIFVFLGAVLGSRIIPGAGSRWTMALGALFTVILSTGAGFGISSAIGLFYGPVHSVLPFVLLGIGVDDVFVIVNAFDRERGATSREFETNADLIKRSASALARAGASITVTSMTDLVAFAISASSGLPALASFCGYAAVCITFLWLFASTFFTGCLVLDERRQRDNRRECICCFSRSPKVRDGEEPSLPNKDAFKENFVSKYFRKYHCPAILSKAGKTMVLVFFAGLLGLGVYGAMNLSVEDSERNFIPQDSYVNDYIASSDEYFPSSGSELFIVFENPDKIYADRTSMAGLAERVSGLSKSAPYIAEPEGESYRNVMSGLQEYLSVSGTDKIGNVTLGSDNWPTTQQDFVLTLKQYAANPENGYSQDVKFSPNNELEAVKVKLQYIKLIKKFRGRDVQDSDKQIEAMDETRKLVDSWNDLPPRFTYSSKYLSIEGFKVIRRELFQNVGLAIAAVGIIVLVTVADFLTALLITLNVAFCIVEILGCMFYVGIVIDSVSVINIVLAVGLSVDYSAHVGHCFMATGGNSRNERVTEALADIGAAVVSGAFTTFLAVSVLLGSSSYVFKILSTQFALTVALGVIHGLILLPVMLSLVGSKAYSSSTEKDSIIVEVTEENDEEISNN